MKPAIHEDKTFEKIDYSGKAVAHREFDHCNFVHCNFSKTDWSNSDFIDCRFHHCDFSLSIMKNTGIKNCHFENCKMMGIDFSVCNDFLFSVKFQNCHLDYSSFFQKKLKKTGFLDCSLKEVDFTETDLSNSIFKNCDLLNAVFSRTILEKADFRTAVNYAFDPELNKIKKAKFSYLGLSGILAKYDIEIEFD